MAIERFPPFEGDEKDNLNNDKDFLNPDIIDYKEELLNPDIIDYKEELLNPDIIDYKEELLNPELKPVLEKPEDVEGSFE